MGAETLNWVRHGWWIDGSSNMFLRYFRRDQLQLIFITFHEILFPEGNWQFPPGDYMITLFQMVFGRTHNTGSGSSANAGHPGLVCRFCIVAI